MANIYPPTYPQLHTLDFHPHPVAHAPSPLAFGFGLASTSPGSSSLPSSSFVHHHHQQAQRPQKRRLELEDDDVARRGDDAMDRSPTPERPKRAAPKRLRVAATEASARGNDKDSEDSKENKTSSSDVDVGVLLASLPQQSLLPLMMALLREQPGLKPLVLSLLPRPTLETALQALAHASKTLRDAYPYSAPPSTSFGFGSGAITFGSARSPNASFGSFGRVATPQSSSPLAHHGGMRDSYIISRLRPHISEFISTCFSYLPYFSYLPPPAHAPAPQVPAMRPHASETFTFLSTTTSHLFSQPQLAQNEMSSRLMPRLLEEWSAWVDRVDEVANRQGGMFSAEVARGWERSLDEFADKDGTGMKEIRDKWIVKVGWLVGRRIVVNMEEDEEL